MGKKELPDDIPPELLIGDDDFGPSEEPTWVDKIKEKLDHYKSRIFSIIKLAFGLCFLVFVYSSTLSFLGELKYIDKTLESDFWAGIITFIIVHFFVFELAKVYQKGHRLLEIVFKFFAPLVKVAPYVLPIYSILVVAVYSILNVFYPSKELTSYFVFFFGFSLTLHLVFSSKTIRGKQKDFLKANYIFGFSLVYIIDILLVALCFNFVFEKFSFVSFFNNAFLNSQNILNSIIKQIFVLS